MEVPGENNIDDLQNTVTRLRNAREALNTMVTEVHCPSDSGITPWQAIGRAVRYKRHRVALGWSNDRINSPDDLEKFINIAKKLGDTYSRLSPEDFENFEGIEHSDWSLNWAQEFSNIAGQILENIDRLQDDLTQLIDQTNWPFFPENIKEIELLIGLIKLFPQCATAHLEDAININAEEKFNALQRSLDILRKYRESLDAAYEPELIQLADIDGWVRRYEVAQRANFIVRIFSKRKLKFEISKYFQLKSLPELGTAIINLPELKKCLDDLDRLQKNLPKGMPWQYLETDIAEAENWLQLGRSLKYFLCSQAEHGRNIVELRQTYHRLFVESRDMLKPNHPIDIARIQLMNTYQDFQEIFINFKNHSKLNDDQVTKLEHIKKISRYVIDSQPRLNTWCRWIKAKQQAFQYELKAMVEALLSHSIEATEAGPAFKTAYCRWLAPKLIDSHDSLRQFNSDDHENLIREFREQDTRHSTISGQYIRNKLAMDITTSQNDSGFGILEHQLGLQRPSKPVRKLINDMGEAFYVLVPCVMMSPLSVAQFLPADAPPFDLVIFDEASQIPVWDAIGAVARGKKVIVVGDPKQMPPTNFFQKAWAEDEDNDDDIEDMESILDEAISTRVPASSAHRALS